LAYLDSAQGLGLSWRYAHELVSRARPSRGPRRRLAHVRRRKRRLRAGQPGSPWPRRLQPADLRLSRRVHAADVLSGARLARRQLRPGRRDQHVEAEGRSRLRRHARARRRQRRQGRRQREAQGTDLRPPPHERARRRGHLDQGTPAGATPIHPRPRRGAQRLRRLAERNRRVLPGLDLLGHPRQDAAIHDLRRHSGEEECRGARRYRRHRRGCGDGAAADRADLPEREDSRLSGEDSLPAQAGPDRRRGRDGRDPVAEGAFALRKRAPAKIAWDFSSSDTSTRRRTSTSTFPSTRSSCRRSRVPRLRLLRPRPRPRPLSAAGPEPAFGQLRTTTPCAVSASS
jgi:hypothetical protein